MENGTTIMDPETVFFSWDTSIDKGCSDWRLI